MFRVLVLFFVFCAVYQATPKPDATLILSESLVSRSFSRFLSEFAAQGFTARIRTVPPDKIEYTAIVTRSNPQAPVLDTVSSDSRLSQILNGALSNIPDVEDFEFTILLRVQPTEEPQTFHATLDPDSMRVRTKDSRGEETGHGPTLNAVLDIIRARGFEELRERVLRRYLGAPGSTGQPIAGGLLTLINAQNEGIEILVQPGQINASRFLEGSELSMHYEKLHPESEKTGFLKVTARMSLGEGTQ